MATVEDIISIFLESMGPANSFEILREVVDQLPLTVKQATNAVYNAAVKGIIMHRCTEYQNQPGIIFDAGPATDCPSCQAVHA